MVGKYRLIKMEIEIERVKKVEYKRNASNVLLRQFSNKIYDR